MANDWLANYQTGKPPQTSCSVCGRVDTRMVTIFYANQGTDYCRLHNPNLVIDRLHNPFENFTVEHARDEHGKPVKVNSLKELRAAEKKYNFALALASEDGSSIHEPRSNTPGCQDIRNHYEWKWARDPRLQNDMTGVNVQAGLRKDIRR